MERYCRWILRGLIGGTTLISPAIRADADTYVITVNALENTVREPQVVQVPLPAGPANLTLMTTGIAQYSPSQPFSNLVVEHKDGAASFQREVPIGESLQLEISNTLSYPLNFFFVDSDASDNSGLVEITVLGSTSAVVHVSPMLNCLSDFHAASIVLPSTPCEVSAVGNPSFGWGRFATVLLMYSGSFNAVRFRGVELGATPTAVPLLAGGIVRLFFADGFPDDNTGSASVRFDCAGTVMTAESTWGSLKSVYR